MGKRRIKGLSLLFVFAERGLRKKKKSGGEKPI